MKRCTGTCKELKEFSEFTSNENGLYSGVCTECRLAKVRAYDASPARKTEKAVIVIIYKTQKSNSKRRNHIPPSYTKRELSEWLYSNGFKKLFAKWEDSGYNKMLKPSVDRLRDELP